MAIFVLIKSNQTNSGYEIVNVDNIQTLENDYSNVIFMLNGEDTKGMKGIMERIQQVCQDLDGDIVPCILEPTIPENDIHYTYGYFHSSTGDNKRRWQNSFYIGKGQSDRWRTHINDAFNRKRNHKAPRNAKESKIMEWLGENYHSPKQARNASIGILVQRLYEESGGLIPEARSFFTEYLLIMRAINTQDLTNRTAGNRRYGNYTAIVQPLAFNKGDVFHSNLWDAAVREFCHDPCSNRIDITILPGLRFIGLEKIIKDFDKEMETAELLPFEMHDVSENRLKAISKHPNMLHISVSGAADPILSYRIGNSDVPYRYDLRVQPGGLETTITLRPLGSKEVAKTKFIEYFESRVLNNEGKLFDKYATEIITKGPLSEQYSNTFICNKKDWPYFKPLAPDANGRNAPWFDITKPDEAMQCDINWVIEKKVKLSLIDSIKLINHAFN